MHWKCILFFRQNKQQSHNSDDTHHFSLTTNKIPRLFPDQINSLTFQVNGNPVAAERHIQTSDLDVGPQNCITIYNEYYCQIWAFHDFPLLSRRQACDRQTDGWLDRCGAAKGWLELVTANQIELVGILQIDQL